MPPSSNIAEDVLEFTKIVTAFALLLAIFVVSAVLAAVEGGLGYFMPRRTNTSDCRKEGDRHA